MRGCTLITVFRAPDVGQLQVTEKRSRGMVTLVLRPSASSHAPSKGVETNCRTLYGE